MVFWGTIVVGILTSFLLHVHGQFEEIWPNRCRLLSRQLLSLPLKQPFDINSHFWTFNLPQIDPIFIPKDEYKTVKIEETKKRRRAIFTGQNYTVQFQLNPITSKDRLAKIYTYLSGVSITQLNEARLESWFDFAKVYRHGIKLNKENLTCDQKDHYLEMIDY